MADGTAFVEVVADTSNTEQQMERDLERAITAVEDSLPPVDVQAALDSDAGRQVMAEAERVVAQAQAALPDLEVQVDTQQATQQVEQFTRDANGRLRDARGRFVTASRELGDSIGTGVEEGSTRGRRSLSDFTDSLRTAGTQLTSFASNGAKPAGIALLAFVAAAGASIAATAGLGVAFAGLGTLALKNVPEVQDAFKSLGSTIKAVGQAAAQPLQAELIESLGNLETAAIRIGPQLRELFAASQPFLEALADGLSGLVENLLPGFSSALGKAQPVADALEEVLSELGTALGETFAAFAEDPEATAQAFTALFGIVTDLLPAIAALTGVITQVAGPALAGLGGVVSAVAFVVGDLLAPALSTVVNVLTGDFDAAINQVAASGAALTGQTTEADGAQRLFSEALQQSTASLFAQSVTEDAAAAVTGVYADAVLATNVQLAQQKADADSLRQSLFALTDVTRGATDAQSVYEDSVDSATGAVRKNGEVLDYQNGRLNLNDQRARDVYDALSLLAQNTQDYSAKTLEATGSTEEANKVFRQGEKRLIALADKAGLSADEAARLAREILGIPPVKETKIRVKYETVGAGPAQNKPLPPMAEGGIVRTATAALVGEAGPEVVIPLTDPQRAAQLVEASGLFGVLAQAGNVIGGGPAINPSLPSQAGPRPVTGPIMLPPGFGDRFREGPVPVFNLFIGGQPINELVEVQMERLEARQARELRNGTRR